MGALMLGLTGLSLLGTGAAIGLPIIDGSYARNMREQILADGPYNPEGDFNTNWIQNRFIDQNSLKAQWQKREYNDAINGPQGAKIMDIQRLTGNPFKIGMNANSYINQNLANYNLKKTAEEQGAVLDLETKKINLLQNTPDAILNRDVIRNQIKTNAEAQKAALEQARMQFGLQFAQLERQNQNDFNLRKDQAKRQYKVDMRALDNDVLKLGLMKQQQNNEMTKHSRELEVFNQNRREDKLLALANGLSALGASFVL